MSWLKFNKREREEGRKTDIYDVVNDSNQVHVGQVKWYGGFRKYVFEPAQFTLFDASCLIEISQFLSAIMEERKHEK
jgi:hypothetical protein